MWSIFRVLPTDVEKKDSAKKSFCGSYQDFPEARSETMRLQTNYPGYLFIVERQQETD